MSNVDCDKELTNDMFDVFEIHKNLFITLLAGNLFNYKSGATLLCWE